MTMAELLLDVIGKHIFSFQKTFVFLFD